MHAEPHEADPAPDTAIAGATEPHSVVNRRQTLWLSGGVLAVCLCLQRFSVPLGGRTVSIVGPICLAMMVAGLVVGAVRLDRVRLIVFLGFSSLVLLGGLRQAVVPVAWGGGENPNSRLLFLLLSSFSCLTFAAPIAEAAFFEVVTTALLLVAGAGTLQFLAQFIGLHLFSFTGLLPDRILVESFYHLEIPVGVGGLLKSNGLTLVEPSVFSQMMALGVIIEALGPRRRLALALFALGLVLSFSGTGWIVLGAFILGSAVAMGRRGAALGAGIAAFLGTVLAIVAVAAPEAAASLASRLGEINQPGTSGHMRFVTPFWMLHDVFSAEPWALALGIGSGKSELLTLPYDYAVNTAVKIVVEYGVPAFIAYALLFICGQRTRRQTALLAPVMVLVFLTGGYQDFPPVLFPALLLVAVARLDDGRPAGHG